MGFREADERKLKQLTSFAWILVAVFAVMAIGVWYTGFKLSQPKAKCSGLPDYLSYEKHSMNEKGALLLTFTSGKDLILGNVSINGLNLALSDEKKKIVPSLRVKKGERTTIRVVGPPQQKTGQLVPNELRLKYNFQFEDRQRIAVANCTTRIE